MENSTFTRKADGRTVSRGLYHSRFEHSSCGVGFVAQIDGTASHDIVQNGIQILTNLQHRGAIGGDKTTGDGAGIMIEKPDRFFRKVCDYIDLPGWDDYAVGTIFFPPKESLKSRCVATVEDVVKNEGCKLLGWRDVPVSSRQLGRLSRATEPCIKQLFVGRGAVDRDRFPQKLYVIRRLIEKEVAKWNDADYGQFYIVSLSSEVLIYKGLLIGEQLPRYFDDLNHPDFMSPFTVVHQRFSTNTLPTWGLAQPFRYIAHNGEINTLRGNINRMQSREAIMSSSIIGDDLARIRPIINEEGSDSAIFDNVLELFHLAGRSLPHVMMMMVPEAYSQHIHMSEDKRAFYEFHSSIMEPWDGPAALVFADGRYIGATLDRNGLRPARYTITDDGLIILASETGVLDIPGEKIRSRGRLMPGKMFLVDLKQRRIVPDNEIKAKITRERPYRRWIKDRRITLRGLFTPSYLPGMEAQELVQRQTAFGYTDEDLRTVIRPMAHRGQEAIGSMGNDTPLSVLSPNSHSLFSYFKQMFAQVTNPPIDPLREELVMSLESLLEKESNPLEESPTHHRGLKLYHPILSFNDMMRLRESRHPDLIPRDLEIVYDPGENGADLQAALKRIFRQAEKYIEEGVSLLILTDRNVGENRAPIPILLVAAGLHHYLIRRGLRPAASIIAETGEVREVIHFALLLAYGTDAVCPYLAFHTIRQLAEKGLAGPQDAPELAMDNYITAVKKGLLKTFSRMGISTLHSFFGTQIFEAVGISRSVVDEYFSGTITRIEGIGLKEINDEVKTRHQRAYPRFESAPQILEAGAAYRIRRQGDKHFWSPQAIYKLQQATRLNDYDIFKEFTREMNRQYGDSGMLRGMFQIKRGKSIPLEEVEPVENIITRFVTAAMSMGSISKEAHETIAIAMNRIGAKSNSGEGGEAPERFKPLPNGDSKKSAIKQIASGRFGVTTDYLVNADEIQIKMAQGAKPGEGGQLPGHKVSAEIARIRHTTPGVTLISPPPHHDIYSIEDLAQLIFDLKSVNPGARVSVKLVSEFGVGTIAAGVAKAKADVILISGYDGGTGASPLTAIRHAGLPWELGLAETQQSLIKNSLRDRVRLQVDGQLKTGRDLAIAALLGAEEFGFGTSILITLGCVMMRKCHLNTCPVGVATQDPRLRARFRGKPEYVERYLGFIARELREIMAELGFRSVDEMVGRVDLLDFQLALDHWKARHLDLRAILNRDHLKDDPALRAFRKQEPILETDLDRTLLAGIKPALGKKKKVRLQLPIRNVHRTIGARLANRIVQKYGAKGLPEDTITIDFSGSAGQSFGAFLVPGISLCLKGDVNDYLGKGISGGRIVLMPPESATFRPEANIICGNVVLYGATGGEIYINGIAGERFAVRNSGATAVVEGIGDHGCEYMTGGTVVVIGSTGKNFGAGMSGGIAYIYDPSELFDTRCNLDMVDLESVWNSEDRTVLKQLIEKHYKYTASPRAKMILDDWEVHLPLFVKVIPIEYRQVLERIRLKEEADRETLSATEEVFDA